MNISDARDVERRLSRAGALNELCKFAEATTDEVEEPVEPGYVTVAGCGLDLNVESLFSCGRDECRRIQVDNLLKHVWHYFDRIVIDDSLGHFLRYHRASESKKQLLRYTRSFAAGALYIREIGAEPLVEFREKPYPHEWPSQAKAVGLGPIVDAKNDLRKVLVNDGKLEIRRSKDGSASAMFTHPELPMPAFAAIPAGEAKKKSNQQIGSDLIDAVLNKHAEYLTRDVISSQEFKGSLAVGVDFHGRLLQEASSPPSAADVVLNLKLPVLEGVPTHELISIRKTEADSFNRFRLALTTAIRERQKITTSANAESIAQEIERDVLEPELSRIRRRLQTAKSALAKKAGIGITAGIATAACGVVSGYLSLIPAGIMAAVGAAVTAESRFVDDNREIANEDMYFWWKAANLH